MALHKQVADVH